ncbi:protein PAXX isoform X2 [Lampris incognitus]|uniref:protein PAXX isoform X2 n=1 Tax=Lampris incognitus TaxID=2546036 RepID=UPI0024B53C29|nr:protein PAXX isoform X2 [Lampris incognitus]
MEGTQTSSYCIVVDKKSQSKFVCYTRQKSGIYRVCLTDATGVWSKDFTKDTLSQLSQRFALKSAEDCIVKIRSACCTGSVSVFVQDSSMVLHVDSSPGDLSLNLSMLEEPDAKEELRELLFQMADCLSQSGGAGSPSVSPEKNQSRRHTVLDFEPRRQRTGPSVSVKKRLPGDSLINPGSKKKRQATGVAFDEADD